MKLVAVGSIAVGWLVASVAVGWPGGVAAAPDDGASVPDRSVVCRHVNVDDLVYEAADQFITGDARGALATLIRVLPCKDDVRLTRMAAIAACVAHDGRAQAYYEKLPAHARPAVKQRCRQANVALVNPAPGAGDTATASSRSGDPRCETLVIDDMLGVASNQYEAGFPKAALLLVNKALACKQDARIYRTAAQYACAAHDLASARLYLPRVQPYFQASIIQRCQQEGLTLSGP